VKTIIVKDLSRFMRDYIAMGDYLENIFPFMGVRFIAINDNYDSSKEKGNGTELDIQFKNLLYDFYAKDASQKVRSVQNALKAKGRSEEHTSELQSRFDLVCRLLLEKRTQTEL